MRRRICIGLISPSVSLIQILDDIGCIYEEIRDDNPPLNPNYSVIITENPSEAPEELLYSFMEGGGHLLELGHSPRFGNAEERSLRYQTYLINKEHKPGTGHLPFLDLYTECSILKSNEGLNSIYSYTNYGKGLHCWLGLSADACRIPRSYRRKRFYQPDGKHPDEIVAATDLNRIKELILYLLKDLHFQQGLPWVRKWDSPSEKPVFCFRIDTDYGTKQSTDVLFELCAEYGIRASWFLHVKAHKDWLEHFHRYGEAGHEIALHGYEHVTSRSFEKVFNNIRSGLNLMQDAGFDVRGFCAPYGIRNPALEKALSRFSFTYSSEFSCTYDGAPLRSGDYPLQIPVHPVCTGSMARKGFSDERMANYFLRLIAEKTSRFEPVVFYHHPLQPGINAIEQIFNEVQNLDLEKLTFEEYAIFWNRRGRIRAEIYSDHASTQVRCEDPEALFEISYDHTGFNLITSDEESSSETPPAFKYGSASILSHEDIKQLKRPDIQLLKTSALDWFNRNKV